MIEQFALNPSLIYAILVALILFCVSRCRKSPPGPCGLPIIGYYPFLGEDPVLTLHELSKKYENIMSINLMGKEYWILNSYEAIKEAFVTKGDIFTGRPRDEYNLFFIYGDGIENAEGESWRIQSKFILYHFWNFGRRKRGFDTKFQQLFDNVENYIDQQKGKAHDYSIIVSEFALNTIAEFVFSKQYKYNDPMFIQLRDWITNGASALEYFNFYLSGTLFKYYLRLTSNSENIWSTNFNAFNDYMTSLINERKESFDSNNCRDMIDCWLKECLDNPHHEYVKSELLALIVSEVLMDGTASNTSLLYGSIYVMASNPDVQQKVHKEIIENFGTEEFSYSDRQRLPYTQAVMSEIQRFLHTSGIPPVHVNLKETTLQGYNVPKRQKVLANTYALTRNPKYFANPNKFDPNHFIDIDGKYKASKYMFPFGAGIRKCPGFVLAEVAFFIAFVRLMRKYEFTFPANLKSGSDSPGFLRLLNSFEVCAKIR